jgi:type III pantothenate kinase
LVESASASGIWVVDVGNTRTAFGRLSTDGVPADVAYVPTPRTDVAPSAPPWPAPAAIHLASVVAEATPLWEAFLGRLAPVSVWGGPERPIPVRHPYDPPAAPGADRLLAAAAAFARARGPAVVLDAGSAVTCDVVGADGAFLGGAIAPGFRALVRGLALAAPALPAAEVRAEARYPGTATQAAVDAGATAAARGLVRELALRAEEACGRRVRLFVTGGDADLVARFLADRRPEVVPALVLEGLALFAARA